MEPANEGYKVILPTLWILWGLISGLAYWRIRGDNQRWAVVLGTVFPPAVWFAALYRLESKEPWPATGSDKAIGYSVLLYALLNLSIYLPVIGVPSLFLSMPLHQIFPELSRNSADVFFTFAWMLPLTWKGPVLHMMYFAAPSLLLYSFLRWRLGTARK